MAAAARRVPSARMSPTPRRRAMRSIRPCSDGRAAPDQRQVRLVAQQPPLAQFQRERDDHTRRDRIQAVLVAQPVGVEDRLGIADPAHRAERVGRFILRAFHLHGVRAVLHHGIAAAADRAAIAPAVLLDVGIERGRVDVLDKRHLGELVVLGRLVAADVLAVHQHQRAPAAQAVEVRVGPQLLHRFPGRGPQRGRCRGAASGHRMDRLQVFAPHHRARPPAGGGAATIVDDRGDAHQVLAGRADARHAAPALAALGAGQDVMDLARLLAPQRRRGFDGDRVIDDADDRRHGRAAGDQQRIECLRARARQRTDRPCWRNRTRR